MGRGREGQAFCSRAAERSKSTQFQTCASHTSCALKQQNPFFFFFRNQKNTAKHAWHNLCLTGHFTFCYDSRSTTEGGHHPKNAASLSPAHKLTNNVNVLHSRRNNMYRTHTICSINRTQHVLPTPGSDMAASAA